MNTKKSIKKLLNVLAPFVLGGGILYWMYRGVDFGRMERTLLEEMNWGWMLFSLVFGVAAQLFRALRWRQSLEPLGEHPRLMDCVHGVFISYASSLIVPRSGELTRCGVLAKYDGTSFAKALGTVVTERVIDALLLLLLCAGVMLSQLAVFTRFFDETGTDMVEVLRGFTATGYWVTALCLVVTAVFLGFAFRRFAFFARFRQAAANVKAGVMSLRDVKNKPLLVFYSLMSEELRFSRAIVLLGSLWSIVATLGIRSLLEMLNVEGYSFRTGRRRRYTFIGSPEEEQRLQNLFDSLGIDPDENKRLNPGDDNLQKQRLDTDVIIFSGKDVAVKEILDITIFQSHSINSFRIMPEHDDVPIGSNYTRNAERLSVILKEFSLLRFSILWTSALICSVCRMILSR